jgi:hypothetical protein
MILIAVVVLVVAITLFFTLTIRAKDLPAPDPVSPTQHLDDRKAQIYENLLDLQFEYRVGKLSDDGQKCHSRKFADKCRTSGLQLRGQESAIF